MKRFNAGALYSPRPDDGTGSSERQLVTWSIAAPVAMIAVSLAAAGIGRALGEPPRGFGAAVAVVNLTLLVAGWIAVALALRRLAGGRKAGWARWFLGVAMNLFVSAHLLHNWQTRRFAQATPPSSAPTPAAAADRLAPGGSIPVGAAWESVRRQLEEASKGLEGEAAQVNRATAEFLRHLQGMHESMERALQDFAAADVLNPATLTDRRQVHDRRESLARFQAEVQRFRQSIQHLEGVYGALLATNGVAGARAASAVEGFVRVSRDTNALLGELRGTEEQLSEAAGRVLDLLDREWGRWRLDTVNRRVVFQSEPVAAEYTRLAAQVQAAEAAQAQLNQRLGGTNPTR